MQVNHADVTIPGVQLPLTLVAELQDSLLVVMHDLGRLEGLVSHAAENLMLRFDSAIAELTAAETLGAQDLSQVRQTLHGAVTELQFHDMASQLIGHTSRVLAFCAHRLASEVMAPEEGESELTEIRMPERPNPVTQSAMGTGSVDLF